MVINVLQATPTSTTMQKMQVVMVDKEKVKSLQVVVAVLAVLLETFSSVLPKNLLALKVPDGVVNTLQSKVAQMRYTPLVAPTSLIV